MRPVMRLVLPMRAATLVGASTFTDFDREAFHRTFDASVVAFFKARLASR